MNASVVGDHETVVIFADGPGGGNPAPVVLDAAAWSDAQMQQLARETGQESAFVVSPGGTGCDLALRYWVPSHEMSMCGHATIGTIWLLNQRALLPRANHTNGPRPWLIHTKSGQVRALVSSDGSVQVSQPPVRIVPVDRDQLVLDALGITTGQLAGPIRNATTARTKTIVPLIDSGVLDSLAPRWERIEATCAAVESTGLYPFARTGDRQFDARQFPRSSGYPEDPATGIAATALAGAMVADPAVGLDDGPIVIRQGRTMNRPSRMTITFEKGSDGRVSGCWLTGSVKPAR